MRVDERVVRALDEQLRLRDIRQVRDARLRRIARRMQRIAEVHQPRGVDRALRGGHRRHPPAVRLAGRPHRLCRPRARRRTPCTAAHVATAWAAGPGIRRPASTYGKLKRTVATPCSRMPRAKPRRNGCRYPAPAPCAIDDRGPGVVGRARRSAETSTAPGGQLDGDPLGRARRIALTAPARASRSSGRSAVATARRLDRHALARPGSARVRLGRCGDPLAVARRLGVAASGVGRQRRGRRRDGYRRAARRRACRPEHLAGALRCSSAATVTS